ncbi:MAG TPA: hypothetical protein VGE52_07665, partial [Pirellulales bacterium]
FVRLVADAEAAYRRLVSTGEAERTELRCRLADVAVTRQGPVFLGLIEAPAPDAPAFDSLAVFRADVLEIAGARRELVEALNAAWASNK